MNDIGTQNTMALDKQGVEQTIFEESAPKADRPGKSTTEVQFRRNS